MGSSLLSPRTREASPERTPVDEARTACLRGIQGCSGTLIGILTSGPLAVALVQATHPQPPWSGPERFARNYHVLQIVPYAGGLLLVASLLLLLSSVHALSTGRDRSRTTLALLASAVFGCFVLLNYALQTAYVPALARSYQPGDAPLVSALSMANPESLAWALEMWGWGFCGVATWLLAGAFSGGPLERAARASFIANGWISLAGSAWTVLQPGWVMTSAGLIAFALWNVLLAALALLALATFRRRLALLSAHPTAAPI